MTAAAVVAGLGVLVVVGRLLPLEPEASPPDTAASVVTQPPTAGTIRCLLSWPAQQAEAPGIWTIGVVKHSSAAAVVRIRVTFTRP